MTSLDGALRECIETALPKGRLRDAVLYAVLTGGQRLRPRILDELGRCWGIAPNTRQQLAVAIELAHAYSLVHDDLPSMDNADTRRGQPSCHRAFDEATAILAGDALQTLAFEVLARADLETERRLALIQEFAHALGGSGMVGGQMLDLYFADDSRDALEKIDLLHAQKTAALFVWCCRAAAYAAGLSADLLNDAKHLGESLGRAYQLLDDLRDADEDRISGAASAAGLMSHERLRTTLHAWLDKARTALQNLGVPTTSSLWDLLQAWGNESEQRS